ncbi:hypothetical protein AY599_24475 [Leptolyngbya valderiana BDU 20041]|uniref:hypothetical protein n=1 Tax=Baaleninema simplex TaxID=2862350 RepID=UPI00034537E3|nr:hypothetical protein [Baaleninema simplex]MDC0835660.1 hypothetical protein [Geitlerinema sp. CS-897]OAB61426.1 hypothetical protein AY599_24475 [Leptolyngbya valderiana BDU 20041]PPT10768.1 hypothetical protein CKA32_001142 [Geitlerinema sp. FC II]
MAKASQGKPNVTLQQSIERILDSNRISRQDYLQLTSAMLAGKGLTDEDYRQLNSVFDRFQLGRLKVVDERSSS